MKESKRYMLLNKNIQKLKIEIGSTSLYANRYSYNKLTS